MSYDFPLHSGPDWTAPIPGVEFFYGKLINFGTRRITVTKAWPPRSWKREVGEPWRNDTPDFAVTGIRDEFLRRRLGRLQSRYFVTPPACITDAKGVRHVMQENGDGTVGVPFEDGWHSKLPWAPAQKSFETRRYLRSEMAHTQFQLSIPQTARLAVRRFESSQHAALLGLLARFDGPAYDLAESNPSLALALANLPLFMKGLSKPWRSAGRLLKRRQRYICARLGFSDAESTVKLLRKIKKAGLKARHLLFLRTTLCNDGGIVKILSHLRQFGVREITLCTVQELRDHITPAFLEEVSELPPSAENPRNFIVDTLRMSRQVNGPECDAKPFQNLAQLRRRHDELADICSHLKGSDVPFGQPPFPAEGPIRPLLTEADLRREGAEMRNCVGSYGELVRFGKAYIYHVDLDRESCTLSLAPDFGRGWRVRELKSFANRKASYQAQKLVHEWLGRYDVKTAVGAPSGR